MRLLELELSQNLLVRNGRGAAPTEAGRVLLEHGRGTLHQMARAREDMERLRGGLSGRVAVGLPPSVARVLAVPLIRAFRDELPAPQLSSPAASHGAQGVPARLIEGGGSRRPGRVKPAGANRRRRPRAMQVTPSGCYCYYSNKTNANKR